MYFAKIRRNDHSEINYYTHTKIEKQSRKKRLACGDITKNNQPIDSRVSTLTNQPMSLCGDVTENKRIKTKPRTSFF